MNIEGWHEIAAELKKHKSRETAHAALKAMGFRCDGGGASSWFFVKPGLNFGVKLSDRPWLGSEKHSIRKLLELQESTLIPFSKIHWIMSWSEEHTYNEFSACICEIVSEFSESLTKNIRRTLTEKYWPQRSHSCFVLQDSIELCLKKLGLRVWDLHRGNVCHRDDETFVIFDFDCFIEATGEVKFSWEEFWRLFKEQAAQTQ